MRDLFTYGNGKPIVSPWRKLLAQRVIDVECAIAEFCSESRTPTTQLLNLRLKSLRDGSKEPSLRNAMYRLSMPDPWVAAIAERIQAIEATIALLKASGQL